MRIETVFPLVVAGAFALCSAASVGVAQGQPAPDDAKLIASAMSAAPKPIAEGATVVAMSKDGHLRTVRAGTNGYTCMPDNPLTPGPDPMCMDPSAMAWVQALMSHAAPPDTVGFMYMMAGGSDASNTDPYAAAPAAGNHWIATGPHVMIVGPAAKQMAGYPSSPDPDTTKPYVMWAGTPYAHLMIPMK